MAARLALLIAQAGTFDGKGVTAFAQTAQEGLGESPVANVLPRGVGHVACNERGFAVMTLFHEFEADVRLLCSDIEVAELIDLRYA